MWVKNIGVGLLLLCFGVTASMAQQTDGLPKDSLKMGQQAPLTYYDRIEPTVSEKYVIVYKDSVEVDRISLLANDDVAKSGYLDSLRELARKWSVCG